MTRQIIIETAKPLVLLVTFCTAFALLYPVVSGASLGHLSAGLYVVFLIGAGIGFYFRAVRKVWEANR
ncbi:MAG: hypothetical protein ACTS1Z_14325 [Parasphingopyxis sp.]